MIQINNTINREEKIKLSLTYSEIQKLEKLKNLTQIKGKRGALHYLLHERYTTEKVDYEKEFIEKVADFSNKKISVEEFNLFISEIAKNKKSQMILFFDSLLYQHPTAEIVRKSYSISKQDKKILDDIVSSLKENNISKRNVTQSTVIRLLLQGFEVYQAMSSAECIGKLTAFQEKLTELINIYGRAEFDCLISEIVKKYSDISNEFEIHVNYIAQLYEINTYVIDFIDKIQQKEGA